VDASSWQKAPWDEVSSQKLNCHMGAYPPHFPDTRVKLAYDEQAIYLMFRVQDRYVRALAQTDQDRVYQDSCVEFFFTPGPDPEQGYFNLEMNCGGTILFHFQTLPRQNPVEIPVSDCALILRDASLPKVMSPEVQDPVRWFLGARIPFDLLSTSVSCSLVIPFSSNVPITGYLSIVRLVPRAFISREMPERPGI
jgi:hypothetical protein